MAKALVEYIITQLIDHQDQLKIAEIKDGSKDVIEVILAGQDLGKVIGKGGQTIRALRTLVNAWQGNGQAPKDIIVKTAE